MFIFALMATVTVGQVRSDEWIRFDPVTRSAAVQPTPHQLVHNSFATAPRPGPTASSASRQRLLAHIKQEVHKQQNMDLLPIHVMVKLIPIKIQDLNEKNEVLETTIRLQLTWVDPRLMWNPRSFYNVTEMVIPGHCLWTPDVGILNSVSDIYHVVRDTRFEMKVENTGRVWWHPTGIVKTYCKLRLLYFPFDKQRCSLVLESPTLDIRFMNLTLRTTSKPIDTRMYLGGETWNLRSVTGKNVMNQLGSHSLFTRVEFIIHVERARIYHILNVIFPAAFLSLVQLLFFFLPPSHVQRVGSSTTTLLSVVVFHSVAVSQLPKTSTDVPLLAIYIFIVTFVSGISVCTSVLMAKFIVFGQNNRKIPYWIRHIPNPMYRADVIRRRLSEHFIVYHKKDTKQTQTLPSFAQPFVQSLTVADAEDDERNGSTTPSDSKEPELRHIPELPRTQLAALRRRATEISEVRDPRRYMFNDWNDISHFVDFCLMWIAVGTAISSPIIMFVIIPYLADD